MTADKRTGRAGDAAGRGPAGQRDTSKSTTGQRHGADPRQSHYFIQGEPAALTHDELLDLALTSIAMAGCTCSPVVKVWNAAQYLRVEHDDARAVLAGGRAA